MMDVLVRLLLVGVVAYVVPGWLQAGRRAKLGLTDAAVVAVEDNPDRFADAVRN